MAKSLINAAARARNTSSIYLIGASTLADSRKIKRDLMRPVDIGVGLHHNIGFSACCLPLSQAVISECSRCLLSLIFHLRWLVYLMIAACWREMMLMDLYIIKAVVESPRHIPGQNITRPPPPKKSICLIIEMPIFHAAWYFITEEDCTNATASLVSLYDIIIDDLVYTNGFSKDDADTSYLYFRFLVLYVQPYLQFHYSLLILIASFQKHWPQAPTFLRYYKRHCYYWLLHNTLHYYWFSVSFRHYLAIYLLFSHYHYYYY